MVDRWRPTRPANWNFASISPDSLLIVLVLVLELVLDVWGGDAAGWFYQLGFSRSQGAVS
jgi:hypothetical protein